MYVNDGAYVRKGQLLAELDPTDYQIQLDAAEAEYHRVKAEDGVQDPVLGGFHADIQGICSRVGTEIEDMSILLKKNCQCFSAAAVDGDYVMHKFVLDSAGQA